MIAELKHLLEAEDVMAIKEDVDRLKTRFYSEPEPVDEEAEVDTAALEAEEAEFKELLTQYKAKRAEVTAAQTKEQQENLARKQAILEEMRQMVEGANADGVMANLQRMRELQAEWKTIGPVPAPNTQEIRKAYQQCQEQFYDLVKINIELRDLDFKKNLELKTLLCEAAERLQNNDNIVEASRALQQLHDEWAEIGPVARELREAIWERFKAASSVINKKHQAYFDQLHAKEQENLERKRAIIEKMKQLNEPIVNGEPINAKRWESLTQEVQALQAEWRTIGFAPKKFNQAIYDEYRAECDRFFHAKAEYFREIRDSFATNLKRKRALLDQVLAINAECAKAEWTKAEWDEATKRIVDLQAEWKTIGAVTRKFSEDLWKQFTGACDAFFAAKREAAAKARGERREAKAQRAVQAAASQGIEALRKMRDRLQQEIKTAENNILFFTSKSKTTNKLVEDMQRKIDALKAKLEDIKAQIEAAEED